MKKKLIFALLLCLAFALTAFAASQGVADSEAYGKVLFCDDFESYTLGTNVINGGAPAFVGDAFTNRFGAVRYGEHGGSAYDLVSYGGSKRLKIAKAYASQRWPQIVINFDSPLIEGVYTLSYTATYPNESSAVSRNSIRFNLKKTDGSSTLFDPGQSLSKGETKRLNASMIVGGGSEFASVTSFLVFFSADDTTEGSFIYIDDLALYAKNDKITYTLPDGAVLSDFISSGDAVTLAGASRFNDLIADDEIVVGFERNGVRYAPFDEFATNAGDSVTAFDVIVEKKTYPVCFSPDTAAGTLPAVSVQNGETVVAPTSDAADFVGWYVPGVGLVAGGKSFVYNVHTLLGYLDADGVLVAKAVFSGEQTLNTPALPSVSFAGNTVTVGELVRAALAVKDGVYGENRVLPTDGEALVALAVSEGLLDGAMPSDQTATVADAVRVLANTLPDRWYTALANIAYAGDAGTLQPYADKLARAGIIATDENLSLPLTAEKCAALMEKLVDNGKRSTDKKRTIFVFGDSLCDPSPSYNSWAEKFRALLDDDIELVNYAVGGYNNSDFLGSTASGAQSYNDMLSRVKPGDYVFVALGTNDATLWMWKDHPELSQGGQKKDYNTSRDAYHVYTKDARAAGAIPVYIVPVSRNIDRLANDPYYLAYDNRIVTCMKDANAYYGDATPILNFKTVTDPLINGQMTSAERAAFYADTVHYTDSGAQLVAEVFRGMVLDDGTPSLAALAAHLTDDFDTSVEAYEADLSVGLPGVNDRTTVRIRNNGDAFCRMTVIAAAYDDNTRLIGLRAFQSVAIAPKQTLSFDIGDIANDGAYYKIFVLDDALRPLVQASIADINSGGDALIDVGELL